MVFGIKTVISASKSILKLILTKGYDHAIIIKCDRVTNKTKNRFYGEN